MGHEHDERIVLTLDVGGTDLVFSAMQSEKEIVPHFVVPARVNLLRDFLDNLVAGFRHIIGQLPDNPVAISSSFPGPADYERGIIGDLVNLPTFRGGVAVGPMLEHVFQIPVFLNNDGDLFTFGEAQAGLLPHVNRLLEEAGSHRRYHNLLGVTFGTGFGSGIVHRQLMLRGDNSAAAEINRMRNRLYPDESVEESASIRGVRRAYAREANIPIDSAPDPKDIFEIGMGRLQGDRRAARKAFEEMAIVAGDALANAVTLVDGLVVLGGGLARAGGLFQQRLVAEMNEPLLGPGNELLPRMESRAYNLDDEQDLDEFLHGELHAITVPSTDQTLPYDPVKRVGVGQSRLGTQLAMSLGAYAYALAKLDEAAHVSPPLPRA